VGLKLTMTCGPYDRAQALIKGEVRPEGIDLDIHVTDDPGRPQTQFDVAEFYVDSNPRRCFTRARSTRRSKIREDGSGRSKP